MGPTLTAKRGTAEAGGVGGRRSAEAMQGRVGLGRGVAG
jgi:hypothetical protein